MLLIHHARKLFGSLGIQGAAMMEAMFIFPFLFISYVGVVSLTQYIETHRNIFQVANQVAAAMSMQRVGDINVQNDILKFGNVTSSPDDISVSYIFCGTRLSNPAVIAPTTPIYTNITGAGTCGRGTPSGSDSTRTQAVCPASMPGPKYNQFVVVTTSCMYTPMFNALGLFNTRVGTTVNVPFRELSYIIP